MTAKPFSIFALLLLVCAAGLFFSVPAPAFPDSTAETFVIVTDTQPDPKAPDLADTVFWTVVRERKGAHSHAVSFYPEDSSEAICRILISGSQIEWTGDIFSSNILHQDDLFVAPGFPVPCDVLPAELIAGSVEQKHYDIRRSAGSRSFLEQVTVSFFDVTVPEALEKQWLRENSADHLNLRMVRAVHERTGELIVQQLWLEGGTWWVYEETPYRRSRRVP
jgi:hypothetical protein